MDSTVLQDVIHSKTLRKASNEIFLRNDDQQCFRFSGKKDLETGQSPVVSSDTIQLESMVRRRRHGCYGFICSEGEPYNILATILFISSLAIQFAQLIEMTKGKIFSRSIMSYYHMPQYLRSSRKS